MINAREISRHQGRPVNLYLFKGVEPQVENLLRSVCVIPGSTEFGYGTTAVAEIGTNKQINRVGKMPSSDFVESINDLLASTEDLKHVNLVVVWFGNDLRIGNCQIRPKVENSTLSTTPYQWQVGSVVRSTAAVMSQVDNKPAFGGTPSDRSVYEAIVYLKSKGLKVTLNPMVLMDVPAGNTLPNPQGGTGQPAYPWRGRITCHPAPDAAGTVDNTATAQSQMTAFFGAVTTSNFSWNTSEKRVNYTGSASEWSYRRFILHTATIALAAGADDILLGSEMVGVTNVRNGVTNFVGVNGLVTLAADVRTIVGSTIKISYGADWSEYHSHKAGTNLVFHLDTLWANANINYIGISNYLPVGDWRDGTTHLDRLSGFTSPYEKEYIQKNIESGEYFDWYYASSGDRTSQIRSPITDGAYNEPWVWRQKDIRSWATTDHFNRISGVKSGTKTAFTPNAKKIVFTEIGFPAIEKAINQPNSFFDSKSTESGYPYFSNMRPDEGQQRAALQAVLEYWQKDVSAIVDTEKMSIWSWDARPYPTFPDRSDYFGDAANWKTGHWLNGRLRPGLGFNSGSFGPFAFCDGETAITRAGITYQPWPIEPPEIDSDGTLDKSDITIKMARGSLLENEFIGFPPSHPINLIIFQGHVGDSPTLIDYPATWVGRVGSPIFGNDVIQFSCVPVSTSIQRPGLRRNYQLACPHALFGNQCRASKKAATFNGPVYSLAGTQITLNALTPVVTDTSRFIGGLIEWTNNGITTVRTIIANNGMTFTIRGSTKGLLVGSNVKMSYGCRRTQTDCSQRFNNILNYGGQPSIPLENPITQKNIFY